MGNCASSVQTYTCDTCGQSPATNKSLANKNMWVVHSPDAVSPCAIECKSCFTKAQLEKEKFAKEREFYSRAKKELYPRQEKKPRLTLINEQSPWDLDSGEDPETFAASWRPPSTLEHLVDIVVSRKGVIPLRPDAAGAPEQDKREEATELMVDDDLDDDDLMFIDEEDASFHGGNYVELDSPKYSEDNKHSQSADLSTDEDETLSLGRSSGSRENEESSQYHNRDLFAQHQQQKQSLVGSNLAVRAN